MYRAIYVLVIIKLFDISYQAIEEKLETKKIKFIRES